MTDSTAEPTYDLLIRKGRKFTRTFVFKNADGTPIDLTGKAYRLQIRENNEGEEKLVELVSLSDDPAFSIQGDLTVTGVTGTVVMTIKKSVTTALTIKSGVWDLEQFDEDDEEEDGEHVVGGSVLVRPGITQ